MIFPEFSAYDLRTLILESCAQFDLNPQLVSAIILQESGGKPWLSRYEEGFYLKYVKDKTRASLIGHVPTRISLITEKLNRSCSYGLMQIMGQVAREQGFAGESLLALCTPQTNLFYGCTFLVKCLNNRTIEQALLRWNGGGNKEYDNEVLARIDNKEYTKLIGDSL